MGRLPVLCDTKSRLPQSMAPSTIQTLFSATSKLHPALFRLVEPPFLYYLCRISLVRDTPSTERLLEQPSARMSMKAGTK